ncbi:MAG: hypothetical protein AUG14_09390 [Candidatus Rokubacteria bacterium 13_1_20CM_2_68_19]|nr:MAG: hypothetical protein AUH76_00720 [Candidatus Rokubacteria bacterium 13_1_40CM_4_67_11]OLE43228.1 MAG: hypothetical protein AUG14_09390 [Candidatus Rokubacteria bacterium 13_1_20CM_2_68_19]
MFARRGVLSLDGFSRSGADWLERFKPYIEDGKTIVVSPHRVFGPQTNDLVLQLRKRRMSKVILAGMLANMCRTLRPLRYLRRALWPDHRPSKSNEVCPSKWKDEGDKMLLNPGAKMIGKVHEAQQK